MAAKPEAISDPDLLLLCACCAMEECTVPSRSAARGASARTGIDFPGDGERTDRPRTPRAGIGPILLRRVLERFGDANAVCSASPEALAAVEGVGELRSRRLHRSLRVAAATGVAQRERAAMLRSGAELIRIGDPDYPPLLATIADAPVGLFVRGTLERSDRRAVAIVGARRCGAYGLAHAARLATGLSERGYTIVSGGARGIDGEAHRAALRAGGRTIAVFGGGLGVCYPPEHAALFEEIAINGALLSEMPCRMPPRPELFPRRNRIVSGLVLGVIVVEAASRSGALITARLAAEEHHREVMALPGAVDSPRSAGCHRAIREGWAALVTGVEDAVEQLEGAQTLLRAAAELDQPRRSESIDCAVGPSDLAALASDPIQEAILKFTIGFPQGISTAAIADALERPAHEVLAAITNLRLAGALADDGPGRVKAATAGAR